MLRVIGETRSISVSTKSLFLATGNNLTFQGDLSTRAVLCRIDSGVERPGERHFKRDLRKYIPEQRGKLVTAALTILRAYYVAGRPKQNIKPFGRFEEWSDLIRSALVWLEQADPCASRQEIEAADPTRIALGNLLAAWYGIFDNVGMKTKNVIKRAFDGNDENSELLKESLLELAPDNKGGVNERVLGKKLSSFKGRIECGYRLQAVEKHQRAILWKVEQKKD